MEQRQFKRDEYFYWVQRGVKIALRRNDMILVRGRPNGLYEMYNIRKDPGEENDLAKKEPEKFQEMIKAVKNHIKKAEKINWKRPSQK